MAFKFVVLAACLAFANAGIISSPVATYAAHAPVAYAAPVAHTYAAAPVVARTYAAPIAHAPVAYAAPVAHAVAAPVVAKTVVNDEYDPHPQYSYAYDVQDALTGDSKNQHETRDGDVVHGSYSLNDADGTRRTVEYTADPVNGFNAVVHKEPLHAPVVAKVAAPVAYAAPVAHAVAPVVRSYAAPVVARSYAAPLAYSAPIARVAAPVAAYAAHPGYYGYGAPVARTYIH